MMVALFSSASMTRRPLAIQPPARLTTAQKPCSLEITRVLRAKCSKPSKFASQPRFTKKDLRYLSSMFLDSMYLNTDQKIDYLGLWPNNSFKPNLLRYTNNAADKACHVVGYATQVGLTQV